MKNEKVSANLKAGQAFLESNKQKPGIITLPSGLQYEVITEGKGIKPLASNKVTCHYHGTLIDGTVFDNVVLNKSRFNNISFAGATFNNISMASVTFTDMSGSLCTRYVNSSRITANGPCADRNCASSAIYRNASSQLCSVNVGEGVSLRRGSLAANAREKSPS